MSRREETLAELVERGRKEQERYARQATCDHFHCRPTEWSWSGHVREMTCDDCGAVNEVPGL